jgi:hypothetical protein
MTHQKRPNYKEGDIKKSFSSGHTSSAFAGASFIQRRYGFKQAIIPYGLAIATGASRIYAKNIIPEMFCRSSDLLLMDNVFG